MPIRINLLAEQIEAEEARRRDPVKRALWAGGGVIAMTLLICLSMQLRLRGARAELADFQARLAVIDAEAKLVRMDWQNTTELSKRGEDLLRYATNRLYWAGVLDALQRVNVENVRIITLDSIHTYLTNAETRFKTNYNIARPKGGLFGSAPGTNVLAFVNNQLAVLTNRVLFTTNPVPTLVKVNTETNSARISAAVEILKPASATERITLVIEARDYSEVPGRRVDEFARALAQSPYFKERLMAGEGLGIRMLNREIRPQLDPADPIQPNKPFIPFTLECRYEDRIRAHE